MAEECLDHKNDVVVLLLLKGIYAHVVKECSFMHTIYINVGLSTSKKIPAKVWSILYVLS